MRWGGTADVAVAHGLLSHRNVRFSPMTVFIVTLLILLLKLHLRFAASGPPLSHYFPAR
jgi:hypothetical protein